MTNAPQSTDPGRAFRKKVNLCLAAFVFLVLLGCAFAGVLNKLSNLGNQPVPAPTTVQQVIIPPSTVTVTPTSRKKEVEQAKAVTVPEPTSSTPVTATSLPATVSVAPTTETAPSPSSKAPVTPSPEKTSAPVEPTSSVETPSQG